MTIISFSKISGDEAILEELGRRLSRHRLDQSLTQAQLAEQAGVSKRTVERIEAGESAQMLTMVRILRVLGLVEKLDLLVPESLPRPMELVKMQGKTRQRASSKSADKKTSKEPWTWGDDS